MHGGIVEPFSEADSEGATRLANELGVPVFPMEQKGVLRTNCIEYVPAVDCRVIDYDSHRFKVASIEQMTHN